jgi:hypothetical protein
MEGGEKREDTLCRVGEKESNRRATRRRMGERNMVWSRREGEKQKGWGMENKGARGGGMELVREKGKLQED